MRTTSRDPLRRRTRSACGLALALALASTTPGCAHQLTNADLAVGVIAAAVVVGGVALWSVHCNEAAMRCRPSGSDPFSLPSEALPPLTGLRAIPGR